MLWRLALTLLPVIAGVALLGSPALAGDVTGSDAAGDVAGRGLTAAERAALDVVSVRVVGEPGLGVFVTATFRGNFEQRVGRGHLKTALAALVLVPKPGAGVPAGVVTAGKGPVGTVLARTSSETAGAARDGRTVTFFVAGPGFENVASVEVRTLARAPGLAGRTPARAGDLPDVPDVMWEKLLASPSDALSLPADASELVCSQLRELREEVRKQNGADAQLLVEDVLRSERCSYPFVRGWHYEGTPLALLLYDGGPSIGPIAVMTMFNADGIVPGSYAAVITTAQDAVLRSPPRDSWDDPVWKQAYERTRTELSVPDPFRLPIYLLFPFELEEISAKTIVELQSLSTHFIFFENEQTGVRKLVSNPVISGTQLIPGTATFQISDAAPFEIFPIGQDGRTNPATKEELPQPPLTPNLDDALGLLRSAIDDEEDALAARTFRETRQHLEESSSNLRKADKLLRPAFSGGELDHREFAKISGTLGLAIYREVDAYANLASQKLAGKEKEKAVRDAIRRVLAAKNRAVQLILAAKELRQIGE